MIGGMKFMRILVFFDLPVLTKANKKNYTRFRKFLQKDGYIMIQLSVYSRLCNGLEGATKHLKRIAQNLPPAGSVRSLCVTDKQYACMIHWVGRPANAEKRIKNTQLLLF